MRRGSILTLLGIGVVAGGIATAVAVIPRWLPDSASREAGRIHFVIWFVIVICIVIFAVVAAALIYSIARFRAAPDDLSDGPPIHGHTGLEIGWTLVPTLLVTAIAIVSAIVLARNDAQGKDVLHVNVTAQQFAWSFSYPDAGGATSPILRLPKDRSVLLTLHAKDVIHSFWVPEFSQKEDTVPGLTTTLHITPDKLGTFQVICTELCGLGHALMRSSAVVMQPAAFDKWLASQKAKG
jgi:cytochrome c oxidase subunit 2